MASPSCFWMRKFTPHFIHCFLKKWLSHGLPIIISLSSWTMLPLEKKICAYPTCGPHDGRHRTALRSQGGAHHAGVLRIRGPPLVTWSITWTAWDLQVVGTNWTNQNFLETSVKNSLPTSPTTGGFNMFHYIATHNMSTMSSPELGASAITWPSPVKLQFESSSGSVSFKPSTLVSFWIYRTTLTIYK